EAAAQPVAEHAEHGRGQRAEKGQGSEGGEEEHRAGVDHDVPAEDERLHLERPGGKEVGGKLEAEAADPEDSQDQRSRTLLVECGQEATLQDAPRAYTNLLYSWARSCPRPACSTVGGSLSRSPSWSSSPQAFATPSAPSSSRWWRISASTAPASPSSLPSASSSTVSSCPGWAASPTGSARAPSPPPAAWCSR